MVQFLLLLADVSVSLCSTRRGSTVFCSWPQHPEEDACRFSNSLPAMNVICCGRVESLITTCIAKRSHLPAPAVSSPAHRRTCSRIPTLGKCALLCTPVAVSQCATPPLQFRVYFLSLYTTLLFSAPTHIDPVPGNWFAGFTRFTFSSSRVIWHRTSESRSASIAHATCITA